MDGRKLSNAVRDALASVADIEEPSALQQIGPRFLPFADAATKDLPLSRLLRLSLFQVSVGMAIVLSLVYVAGES